MRDSQYTAAQWLRKHVSLVGAFIVSGLAFGLYARAIGFGFMGDDPTGHFRFIEEVPWTQWFTSTPGFFVRPLVFVVYKIAWFVLGGYSAPGFHLVLLLLHVADTLLLYVLASSLSRRPLLGWLAAVLFASFPLSHEAVAGVDALAHPLVTFWVLLALVLFERGHRTGQRGYFWAIHPVTLLGLLTHENSLVIPFLLLALEALYYPPKSAARLLRWTAMKYLVLPILYLLWWLQIPKGVVSAPHSLGEILKNTLPFLQVVAYPILPFMPPGAIQWTWLVVIAGVSLLLAYAASRRLSTVRLWLFAVVWLVTTAAPSVLFLDWDYLHGSPHLYYLASVGAAILWASPPTAIADLASGSFKRRVAAWVTSGILMLAILTPSIRYVNCNLDLWEQATLLVRRVSAQASAAPAGRGLLFVNLPVFFISTADHPQGCRASYPFVSSGVGVFLDYALLRDFIRLNGGPDRPAEGVAVAEYGSEWPPRYGSVVPLADMRDTLQHNQVYVFEVDSWSLRDLSAVWQPGAPKVKAPLATFGDILELEDTAVQQLGNDIVVTLQWHVLKVPAQSLTAFVHVYDGEGKLLAQHDGPPGHNSAPINYIPQALWQSGDRIGDVHTITPSGPMPTTYAVAIGIYDTTTVERLPALTPDGNALRDDVYVVGP